MINIFEVFLPQLLRYPNPNDPLNGEAAALLMRHPKEYDIKVKGASAFSTLSAGNSGSNMTLAKQSTFRGSRRRRRQTRWRRRKTMMPMKR
jgi:hypothetical protein